MSSSPITPRLCAVVLAAGILAACGPGPTASPPATGAATPGPTPVTPTSPAATAGPSPAAELLRVYLVMGVGGRAGLVPVLRPVEGTGPAPQGVIEALLAGPTDLETGARPAIGSAIPAGTRVLGASTEGGTAIVNLSADFEAATEDGLPSAYRVAQVVYSLTALPGIESVRLQIEGQQVTTVGPDQFPVDGPLERQAFTEQLPILFVDEPAWGATISSPVRVAGLANAFEATFQVRIADAEGRGLAAGPVMASCGTGCWGTFDVSVPFSVQVAGPGVIQVFELSAKDGGMDNLREYPVQLVP